MKGQGRVGVLEAAACVVATPLPVARTRTQGRHKAGWAVASNAGAPGKLDTVLPSPLGKHRLSGVHQTHPLALGDMCIGEVGRAFHQ